MKKFFVCLAMAAVLISGCDIDVKDTLEIVIDNKSDFDLSNVAFLGGSIDKVGKNASVPFEAKEGKAVITFDFKPNNQNSTMSCKTIEEFDVAETHRKITINNDTMVIEAGSDTNSGKLSKTWEIENPNGTTSLVGTTWEANDGWGGFSTVTFSTESNGIYSPSYMYSMSFTYTYSSPVVTITAMDGFPYYAQITISGDSFMFESQTFYKKSGGSH